MIANYIPSTLSILTGLGEALIGIPCLLERYPPSRRPSHGGRFMTDCRLIIGCPNEGQVLTNESSCTSLIRIQALDAHFSWVLLFVIRDALSRRNSYSYVEYARY